MSLVRYPAVAGTFYPSDAQQLKQMLAGFLAQAETSAGAVKAIIVPHAGYIYSGPVAASAYKRLKANADHIQRVVLIGPSHRVSFKGLALSHAELFRTPLGDIALDREAVARLESLPFVQYLDEAHYLEHSLEVQLPFLQTVLSSFKLVPVVAGNATPEQVAKVLELFYGDAHTLMVISSDLSHYHDYATAQRLDKDTSTKFEQLRYQELDYDSACGRVPVSGLLALAKQKAWHVKTIDLRNSGDTAGDKTRVVGYGAYIVD